MSELTFPVSSLIRCFNTDFFNVSICSFFLNFISCWLIMGGFSINQCAYTFDRSWSTREWSSVSTIGFESIIFQSSTLVGIIQNGIKNVDCWVTKFTLFCLNFVYFKLGCVCKSRNLLLCAVHIDTATYIIFPFPINVKSLGAKKYSVKLPSYTYKKAALLVPNVA